jgi:hypothetical protein
MRLFGGASQRGNKFPQHLVKAITDKWDHFVAGPDYDRPPLPSRIALRQLLEICYLASLETDEGRSLRFTVCYTSSNDNARYHNSDDEVECWKFDQPRNFTLAEIRRLAATTDLDSSAIWISSPIQNQTNPKIYGLLNPGSSWASARRAFSYVYSPPPSALNIRVTGPGRLNVYQGSYLVASLSSGRIQDQGTMSVNDCFGVLGFIGEGFDQLDEFIEDPNLYLPGMEPLEHEPLKERYNFAWTAYLNTILALVNVIQGKGHGGALIIIRDNTDILTDAASLRIKYLFRPQNHVL